MAKQHFALLSTMPKSLTVFCKVCHHKSAITKTQKEHPELSRIYCQCLNPQCGHRFVLNLQFSHSTKTSQLIANDLTLTLIQQLSDDEKRKIKQLLSNQ